MSNVLHKVFEIAEMLPSRHGSVACTWIIFTVAASNVDDLKEAAYRNNLVCGGKALSPKIYVDDHKNLYRNLFVFFFLNFHSRRKFKLGWS